MKYITLYLSTLLLVVGITATVRPPFKVDAKTQASCVQTSAQLKNDFKGTEFANRPFYQYCIDNIEYTSPLLRK